MSFERFISYITVATAASQLTVGRIGWTCFFLALSAWFIFAAGPDSNDN